MSTQTTPTQNGTDDDRETCPNGDPWCFRRDDDDLPCFACYMDEHTEGAGE